MIDFAFRNRTKNRTALFSFRLQRQSIYSDVNGEALYVVVTDSFF